MIQLASILEDFIKPTLTNTMVEKKKLEDFNFPLLFKICPMVGFNETALKEYGYETASRYFKGESMFNRSMKGWGGHKNDSLEPQDSVEEVYAKVKNYEVGDIVDFIRISFEPGKNKKIISDNDKLYLERVNYPANCFTLNLANDTDIQEKGIIDIGFILKKPENADTKEKQICKIYQGFPPLIQIQIRIQIWIHSPDTDTDTFGRHG